MKTSSASLQNRHRGSIAASLLRSLPGRHAVLACLCFAPLLHAAAADNAWTAGDSSWFTSGNWDLGTAPVAGQTTRVVNGGTARIANGTASTGQLRIGTDSGTTGHVALANGGALSATQILVGDAGNGGGSLTVADNAVATVSDGYGGILVGTNGTVRFGTGGAPGRIAADGIVGLGNAGTIIFDHNSPNFVLTHDVVFNGNTSTGFLRLLGNLNVQHNAGVTVLKSFSSHHGTTDINGGTFVMDAIITDDSAGISTMNVNAQATLGGNGSYNGYVYVKPQGTLAPGNAGAGVGSVRTERMYLYGASTWEIEMSDASGTPGTGWDHFSTYFLAFYNAFEYGPVRVVLRSLNGGVPGPAANFGDSRRWTIATIRTGDDGLPGDVLNFDPADMELDTTQFANATHDGGFSFELVETGSGERQLNLVYVRPGIDVVLPGDAVQGTSANSPAGELPAMATDNSVATKYLNFDELNAGLILHPTGAAPVRALTLISANDAPERDPASFVLEGSDDGVQFTPVASGSVPPFAGRRAIQTLTFANEQAYSVYRLTFPTVSNPTAANSVQIAEVELLPFDDITSSNDLLTMITPPGDASYNWQALVNRQLGTNHSTDAAQKFAHDFLNGTGTPMLDVVPAAGPTVLKGFEFIRPADDNAAPLRIAPTTITVQGTSDGTNFTTLAVVTPDSARSDLKIEEFTTLDNSTAFTRYRFIFSRPGFGVEGQVQFGELRLFGFATIPLTAMESWRFTHFGTTANTGSAALAADPEGDGRNNLLEFATDGNPHRGSDDGKTVSGVAEIAGHGLPTLTLPVRTGAVFSGSGEQVSAPVDGIVYHIQGSTDLSDWTTTQVAEVLPAQTVGLPALNPGWEYRSFCLNPQDRGFLRLNVQTAP